MLEALRAERGPYYGARSRATGRAKRWYRRLGREDPSLLIGREAAPREGQGAAGGGAPPSSSSSSSAASAGPESSPLSTPDS